MNTTETIEARRRDQRNSGTARRLLRRGALATVLLAGVGLALAGAGAAPSARAAGPLPGTVVAWGCQSGTNYGQCSVPAGLSNVTAIAAGDYHSLALKSDGTVVAWGCRGNYDYGQCSVPAGLSGVTAIAAAAYHSLALKSDGTVVAWGCGINFGQCNVPAGLSGVTAIAAGDYHSLALKSDGTVVAWGCQNGANYGQCSVPAGLSGVTAIAAGDYHSLALKSDGTVVAWGNDTYGQTDVPAGLGGVTAIAAGLYDSLAIKSDGTVVAWSCGWAPICSEPSGLTNAIAIATAGADGADYELALKSDGTVVAWGDDTYGQTDVPAGLGGVTAIAAGARHGLALVAPATVTLSNLSQQYDGTAKAASATVDNAFCGPVSLSYSQNGTPVSAPTAAGSYAVQASLGNSSCAIGAGGTGTLVISPAPLTITATNQRMTYGGAVPAFSAGYSGFVGGDTAASLSTAPTCTSSATSSSPTGSYPITCTGALDPNYAISYQPGTLIIAPAPLTITAGSPSVVYDGTVPAIGPTYNGFVNGDSSASLTTAPTCASTAPAGGAAGTYATSCTGAVDPNYSISYQGGSLTITQAPQAIAFAPLPNHALGDAPFTVGATGGASGNPVTFTAGPSAVCTAGGTNGATITLVGTGTCTITASQAGNQNYQAAPSVAQSFTVSAAPLTLALGVSSSPAGPVTTGSTVTATLTLGNHTAQAQTVKLKVTLTYTGGHSYLSVTVSLKPTLSAGQTLNQYARFTIGKLFPRGTYTLSATATDGSGDTATSSAALTVS